MNVRYLLLLGYLFGLSSLVIAQDEKEQLIRNDIGMNVGQIGMGILNTKTIPFNLMYKHYSKSNQAYRFGLGTYITTNKKLSEGSDSQSSFSRTNVFILFGKEFQKSINNNWMWHWGMDVSPQFHYAHIEIYEDNKSTDSRFRIYELRLAPLTGIRYNINSRFYFSAEVKLAASYMKSFVSELDLQQNTEENSVHNSLRLKPNLGLLVFYRL